MNRPVRAGRTALARTLTKAFLEAVGDDPALEAARAFIDQAAPDAAPDEPPELTPEEVGRNLADFWAWSARRKESGPMLRLVPCLGEDAAALCRLEIVQDDCPFIVDSVMGEIAAQGHSVRAMFHPITPAARDRGAAEPPPDGPGRNP